VEGAKLFFPEEFPDLIAEEARRLWGVRWTNPAAVPTDGRRAPIVAA
jgi:hypothetical protein